MSSKNIYHHTAGDRTPYTYLITHKITGKRYYGVRFKKGCHPDEFFKKYFTSSKVIHEIIKNEGVDIFNTEIRRIFDCKNKAKRWEYTVLKRLHVIFNENYYNKCTGNGSDHKIVITKEWYQTEKGLQKAKNHSEYMKNFCSQISAEDKTKKIEQQKMWYNTEKGIEFLENSRKLIIERNKSEKQKEAVSKFFSGRKLTEEHKRKVAENHADFSGEKNPMYGKSGELSPAFGTKWIKNTSTKTSLKIKENLVPEYINNGWELGRFSRKNPF